MLPPRRLLFTHIYISKGAAEMKSSPDVGNDPFNPHMEIKICLTVRNDTGNI